jgi:ribosomal 50S subunit-associated protein YjgA (DUF615 family)
MGCGITLETFNSQFMCGFGNCEPSETLRDQLVSLPKSFLEKVPSWEDVASQFVALSEAISNGSALRRDIAGKEQKIQQLEPIGEVRSDASEGFWP